MLYRAYYNRSEDWPWVWSIDEGTTESEQTVLAIFILPPSVATTQFSGKPRSGAEPVAWLDVSGELEIKDGFAYFS